jgi:hypothetical protein
MNITEEISWQRKNTVNHPATWRSQGVTVNRKNPGRGVKKMKVVLDDYNLEEQEQVLKKFMQAPCIVCDKKMQGYVKVPVGDKIAILPLCNECKNMDIATLTSAMEMIDHARPQMATARPGR